MNPVPVLFDMPHDQRTQSAYIFGAICPAKGKGAALVLLRCTTVAMNAHLQEISRAVARRVHAVLMLDGAGWHKAGALVVPANITLLPLPPRAPELNPPELVEGARTSGSSCATIGSPIACSTPTKTSSTAAARLGTGSSTSP